MLPPIRYILEEMKASLLQEIYEDLDALEDLCDLVTKAIREEPPIAMKEGNIIREGYNEEVDKLRRAKSDGKDWLAKLEEDEREKTGIKNLKIKYNKVFGYYLEVTNSYKDLVPDYYTRKQTLANAERYITPELKELEDMILGQKINCMHWSMNFTVRSERRLQPRWSGSRKRQRRSQDWMYLPLWHLWQNGIIMYARRSMKKELLISKKEDIRLWKK